MVQRSSYLDLSLTWQFVEAEYETILLGDSFSPFIILPNLLVSFISFIQNNPNLTKLTFFTLPIFDASCYTKFLMLNFSGIVCIRPK